MSQDRISNIAQLYPEEVAWIEKKLDESGKFAIGTTAKIAEIIMAGSIVSLIFFYSRWNN